jgi:lipid-binding SYLF domain-containing protein
MNGEKMNRIILSLILIVSITIPVSASKRDQVERLQDAAEVLEEILNIPEGIPQDLLEDAECVVIIPSMKKAAFGIGGNYGKGPIVCRLRSGWSPPVMASIKGGSWGLQIGGSATDLVLLIMNRKGIQKLLESKFTIGVDGSAAAGPKGRTATAATDAKMRAEILAYARSRGLFAGISIQGSVLKPDRGDNEDLYGRRVNEKKILLEGGPVPGSALPLLNLLKEYPRD